MKTDIMKIADELEKRGDLEMYWDYNDRLGEEQVLKILKEEEGLNEIENEIYENNQDFINERIANVLEEYNADLTEEEEEALKEECYSRFKFNIEGLIKQSQINLRIELLSNEDMICFIDNLYKGSETLKEFKRVFKGKYSKADYDSEVANMVNDYGLMTFYFRVRGLNILKLREEIQQGFITLRKGLDFGIFNSYVGGGSVMEIKLKGEVKLNIKDWRNKNVQEAVVKGLEEGTGKSYWNVSIKADNISKYGINEVYGLGTWQEY